MSASAGRSALFWIAVSAAGVCGLCTLGGLGLTALGLLADDAPTTSAPSGATANQAQGHSGRLPTGNTPDLFPGMPGWLPSGRGVPIPETEFVDGEPRGLWWSAQPQNRSVVYTPILFLADGTRATNPRPGAGRLFDLEGHRALNGYTGLGTFRVSGTTITQTYDGFTSTGELSSGEDADGPWFAIGENRFHPLAPPTEDFLVGTWKTAGSTFIFRADGTFESGQVASTGVWGAAGRHEGRWVLDGYLVQIAPASAPGWITTVGATGDTFLLMGDALYSRE